MKLLSLALQEHDANISYYDGTHVHYHKLERTKSSKHYGSMNMWEWKKEIKDVWGITENDVDEIILRVPLAENHFKTLNELSGSPHVTRIENVLDISLFANPQKTWYMKHHYAHALSGWMVCEDSPNVSIVIDGLGDNKSWSVFKKDVLIASGEFNSGSIGYLMMDAGKTLGVESKFDDDYAGKVMGLQSYGKLDYGYLDYIRSYQSIHDVKNIFSIDNWIAYKKDKLLANSTQLDWIRTIHFKMQEVLINFFSEYTESDDDVIFYSGGVAQNVIWNTSLKRKFKNLKIAPHSSDEGLSLGGLEWLRIKNNLPKFQFRNFPYVQSDESPKTQPTIDTIKHVAELLAQGKIVGWYQGNGEIGPRALGNRSILMDPRIFNGKQKINNVKRRENYRPFGGSVLKEYASNHFDAIIDDEYMLYVTNVIEKNLDSITHVDGTCRLQMVSKDINESFHALLSEFYNLTRCAVLLNTSLNVAGKPICGNIDEAKQFFLESELDVMCIGNQLYSKTNIL